MGNEENDIRFAAFLQLHESQLVMSGVPEYFWKSLYNKLIGQIFDANETFTIARLELDEDSDDHNGVENDEEQNNGGDTSVLKVFVCCEGGIRKTDGKQIYLIDHAWTYTPRDAKQHLRQIPGLLNRMCDLMGVAQTEPNQVEKIFECMWKYNNTYIVSSGVNIEDRLPVWYILDEFGSAIQHSDNPNFRVVPFAYAPEGTTYSIMFPIEDVEENQQVTRDYVDGFTDELLRKSLLFPWFPQDFKHFSFVQNEPVESYFTSGHVTESLPDLDALSKSVVRNNVLKVYSDYKFIDNYLTDKRFEIVTNGNDADILWYTSHFVDFRKLSIESPGKYINQFPYEYVITIKDLLSIVCRRACKCENKYNEDTLEIYPLWLPQTFNLNEELPKFISYFQRRKDRKLDNHWICKPWNLARGLDTHITSNLNFIARLPNSGPKIAQKYIESPVLFHREDISEGSGLVKFDIRYVLLLKSVRPLQAYVYRNFFLRFANKSFELDDFDDYEKHFTVMNYNDDAQLYRLLCSEFIKQFQSQYPSVEWNAIEAKIFEMFREMFQAAVAREPPCGIAHSPQSRALYAADLMLAYSPSDITIQPKLLEINWMPDCQRACLYYPDFYNDIFSLLFLNEENHVFHKL